MHLIENEIIILQHKNKNQEMFLSIYLNLVLVFIGLVV